MLARRNTFNKNLGPKNESESEAQAPSPPPLPDVETQKKFEETAREYGVDTSRKVRSEEPSAEITFYKSALKTVGKEALSIIEGGLWAVGGGALVFILAVGTAVAFLAYYKATGTPVPEGLDTFCASGEPMFTPALGLFLSCTTTLYVFDQKRCDDAFVERFLLILNTNRVDLIGDC